jgi:hypothetical protein
MGNGLIEMVALEKNAGANHRRADYCAIGVLGLLVLFFYWRFLVGKCCIWDDTLTEFYPGVNYFAKSLRSGRFPLWFPGVHDGIPFYSDIQMSVFYPPQWLLPLFVSKGRLPFLVYQWYIVFHYLVGDAFLYSYLRNLKLSPIGALSGAITFCFSAFMSLRIVNFVMIQVYVWLPLQLLCVDKLCSARSRWAWLGLIGSLLCSLFAGHPQTTLYCWYFVILYWAYRLWSNRTAKGQGWSRLTWLRMRAGQTAAIVGSFALVLGLGAVLILPALENWSHTARPHLSFPDLADPSLPYHGLLTLLVPNFYGTAAPDLSFSPRFWGYDHNSPSLKSLFSYGAPGFWQYWEFGVYGGQLFLLALLLILFNWNQVTAKRNLGFFLCTWLGAMWFACGRFGGLFDILYHIVPGVSLFRGPSKMSCVAVFATAVITGIFMDLVWSKGGRLRLRPVLVLVAADSVLLILLYWRGERLAEELRNPANLTWSRHETLWAFTLSSLLAGSLFWLVLGTARWVRFIGFGALLAISFEDFNHAYGDFQRSSVNPDEFFSQTDWFVTQVKDRRNELGSFRVAQMSADSRYHEEVVTRRNLPYFVDFLEVPEGYTSFYLDSTRQFQNVTNLFAQWAIQNVKLLAVYESSPNGSDQIALKGVGNVLQRAEFYPRIHQYQSRDALLAGLERGEIDWYKETAAWGPSAQEINELIPPSHSVGTNNDVRFVRKTPEAYSIIYDVAQPGVVFVSQTFYPGWIADGGRFKMAELFGAFQGIVIPAPGHGEITVTFSPPLLKIGLLISLLSGITAILVFNFYRT